MTGRELQSIVHNFYAKEGRKNLPWRQPTLRLQDGSFVYDPYKILVSEVMLQQTQVVRVHSKYKEWMERFPTFESLAHASLRDVLIVWQGLGYNRRGKYLKEAAEKIVSDKRYGFMFSKIKESRNQRTKNAIRNSSSGALLNSSAVQVQLLQELPGIGHATASAIVAYAFNQPVVFIETNIRAVYLYFFFKKESHISDKQIADFVEKTLDYDNPRDWYYALTDYGNMLKNKEKFKNIQSKHYAKQSKFEGSRRQVRGLILRELSRKASIEEKVLLELLNQYKYSGSEVLEDLLKEQLIKKKHGCYSIR